MDEREKKRYRLQSSRALSVPAEDAEKLLALRDGDCALLYLHVLLSGGELDTAQAGRALGRSVEDVRALADKLGRAGLLRSDAELLPPPPNELPEYRVDDILRRSREDGSFKALVAEAQRVMGHTLSGADMKTLFGIYDRLGMPSEVIMLLINHVADRLRRRYGEGRLPTMHAVQQEAFRWVNREIVTIQQAESYIAESDRREQEEAKALRMLGITDRSPTASERKYLDSWLSMGFSSETLALAYDRTVLKTGKLAWAYMNKILLSWQEQGLFTPEDIEKGDVRPGGKRWGKPERRRDDASGGDDADRLARILDVKE